MGCGIIKIKSETLTTIESRVNIKIPGANNLPDYVKGNIIRNNKLEVIPEVRSYLEISIRNE
jgi:hypothetical protein